MGLTLMKSHCTIALMQCARDCSDLIEQLTKNGGSIFLITKARECREACLECVDAFESAQVALRGLLIESVAHACRSFIKISEGSKEPQRQKSIESCKRCLEECEQLLA